MLYLERPWSNVRHMMYIPRGIAIISISGVGGGELPNYFMEMLSFLFPKWKNQNPTHFSSVTLPCFTWLRHRGSHCFLFHCALLMKLGFVVS